MSTVTYRLTDFGGAPLTGAVPRARLVPSGPGVDALGVYASAVVDLPLDAAGEGMVEIVPTVGMTPSVWFSLEVDWFLDSERVGRAFWPHKFRVPLEGGALMDMADSREPRVWIGPTAPIPSMYPRWVDTSAQPALLKKWSV